jgi:hypothetical protein
MDRGQRPQRRVPRYPFSARAATIPGSGDPIGGSVTELSLYGCYLDSTAPLTPRTRVSIKIFGPAEYFEASATGIYANPSLGVGLIFREVKPALLAVLRKWLLATIQRKRKDKIKGKGKTPKKKTLNKPSKPKPLSPNAPHVKLAELCKFRFRLDQRRKVGIRVLPHRKYVLVRCPALLDLPRHCVRAR